MPNSIWFSVAIGTLARNFVSQFCCRVVDQLRIQTYRSVDKFHETCPNQQVIQTWTQTTEEEAGIDATDGSAFLSRRYD